MPETSFLDRRPNPPPAKVNAVTLFVTGTVIWMAGTVAVFVLGLLDRVPDRWLDVCFAGLGLGLLGIGWGYVREYRSRRRVATATAGETV